MSNRQRKKVKSNNDRKGGGHISFLIIVSRKFSLIMFSQCCSMEYIYLNMWLVDGERRYWERERMCERFLFSSLYKLSVG